MNRQLVECYTAGLSALVGSNPGSVERRAKFEAEERGFTGDFGIEQFVDVYAVFLEGRECDARQKA